MVILAVASFAPHFRPSVTLDHFDNVSDLQEISVSMRLSSTVPRSFGGAELPRTQSQRSRERDIEERSRYETAADVAGVSPCLDL
jgi:hypothetical protein